MQLFKLKTRLSEFDSFADFAKEFNLTKEDLIITNEFLYNPYMRGLNLPCRFIMQEQYGMGEPSDEMINHILADIQLENYTRHTKMGLADDALLADDAVLIPELVRGLPYKFFVCSSIDALIHAVESYVSPKSNPYTQIFCRAAIESIIDVFKHIAAQGPEYRLERLKEMLIASNYAGIAFGNTGVGAVHALSYPLGGNYHVPHGEANYQFFTEVFKFYYKKKPFGNITEVNALLAHLLETDTEHVYEELDYLLGKLLSKKPLHTYGMKPEEIDGFTGNVLQTQQRLLANNHVELTREEIKEIYSTLY